MLSHYFGTANCERETSETHCLSGICPTYVWQRGNYLSHHSIPNPHGERTPCRTHIKQCQALQEEVKALQRRTPMCFARDARGIFMCGKSWFPFFFLEYLSNTFSTIWCRNSRSQHFSAFTYLFFSFRFVVFPTKEMASVLQCEAHGRPLAFWAQLSFPQFWIEDHGALPCGESQGPWGEPLGRARGVRVRWGWDTCATCATCASQLRASDAVSYASYASYASWVRLKLTQLTQLTLMIFYDILHHFTNGNALWPGTFIWECSVVLSWVHWRYVLPPQPETADGYLQVRISDDLSVIETIQSQFFQTSLPVPGLAVADCSPQRHGKRWARKATGIEKHRISQARPSLTAAAASTESMSASQVPDRRYGSKFGTREPSWRLVFILP